MHHIRPANECISSGVLRANSARKRGWCVISQECWVTWISASSTFDFVTLHQRYTIHFHLSGINFKRNFNLSGPHFIHTSYSFRWYIGGKIRSTYDVVWDCVKRRDLAGHYSWIYTLLDARTGLYIYPDGDRRCWWCDSFKSHGICWISLGLITLLRSLNQQLMHSSYSYKCILTVMVFAW